MDQTHQNQEDAVRFLSKLIEFRVWCCLMRADIPSFSQQQRLELTNVLRAAILPLADPRWQHVHVVITDFLSDVSALLAALAE